MILRLIFFSILLCLLCSISFGQTKNSSWGVAPVPKQSSYVWTNNGIWFDSALLSKYYKTSGVDTNIMIFDINGKGLPFSKSKIIKWGDGTFVHLTGDETVAGVKTLSSNPKLSAMSANYIPYIKSDKSLSESGLFVDDIHIPNRLGLGTVDPQYSMQIEGVSNPAIGNGIVLKLKDDQTSTYNFSGVIAESHNVRFDMVSFSDNGGSHPNFALIRTLGGGYPIVFQMDSGSFASNIQEIGHLGMRELNFGWHSSGGNGGVSLGDFSYAGSGGISIGEFSNAGNYEATAIGYNSRATGLATQAYGSRCWAEPTGINGNESLFGSDMQAHGNVNHGFGGGFRMDSNFVACVMCQGNNSNYNFENAPHQGFFFAYVHDDGVTMSDGYINNAWFGPRISNYLHDFSLNLTSANGTDAPGANWIYNASQPTGNSTTGGDIIFNTADVGISGTTQQSLSEKLRIKANGGVIAKGTITNDNAASGFIGEFVSSTISSGSALSLTTATSTDITSISLTAGDWDVSGVINFTTTGASSSDFKSGSNSTSATFGGENTYANLPLVATGLSDILTQNVPTTRYSLSSTTTIYLIASASFTVGSISAYGTIKARRIR